MRQLIIVPNKYLRELGLGAFRPHTVGEGRRPWLESVINSPIASYIVSRSLLSRLGTRTMGRTFGALPGSLDQGRMLFGTKGKRTGNSTGAQAHLEKSSVNPGPAVKQEGVWCRKCSVNPGPAVKQEGVWRRKSSVNPGPCCEAGRCLAQEKALYLVRKLRGSHPPVLCCQPMCVCLCVFLCPFTSV